MKLQSNLAVSRPSEPSQPISAGVTAGKSPEASAGAADGVLISSASAALNQLSANQTAKIARVTAAVQAGSYQISSPATANALIEDALSGRN